MSKVTIEKSTLTAIGDAIRAKDGTTDLIPVPDLASRITAIPSGGSPSGENKLAKMVDGSLTEITAEDLEGCKVIRAYAFYNYAGLTSITIPEGVTKIGAYAFQYCTNLKSVTIPDSVTSIGLSAFQNCSVLTSITIPEGVTSIGFSAFQNCSVLTSITIPNSVKDIGAYAFQYCNRLTSITIPNSVKDIGTDALQIGSTTNKATITFLRTTPASILSNIFDATKLAKIIVPQGCGDAYKSATNWSKFADYIEEATE